MGRRVYLVGMMALLVGCADGIDCPDLGLELISPAADRPITLADDRSGRTGVQVDVALSSALQAGESAELVVSGADGGEERHSALANDEGELHFPLVTLPTGDVALSVLASSRRCGEQSLVTALSVLGPACALDLAEEAVAIDDYQVDVLNQAVDSDPAAPGFQAHVEVVSEEGFEVEIFSLYGDDETSAGITVADGGSATLGITLAQGAVSLRAECRSTESSDSSVSLPHEFFVDTVPPVCQMESPLDGAIVDPGLDEGAEPGVQVTVRGRLIGADVAGGPASFTVGGEVAATVAVADDGAASALVSFEQDGPVEVGLDGQDHAENPCTARIGVSVILADVWVAFGEPVADGVVGPADGAPSPGGLEVDLCGTVSEPPDSVAIQVDGGAPVPAAIDGSSFCAPVTLAESPPAHTVSVVAVAGDRQASAELDLVVDLTPPEPPGALAMAGIDRQALEIAFTAPEDQASGVESYRIKIADRPFTAGNFDAIGSELPPPAPGTPGTAQSLVVESLRAGTRYHVGAVARDRAGNRSLLATAGPLLLRLDRLPPVAGGDGGGRFGAALAAGRLDGDGFADLAVGAPLDDGAADRGRVRIYRGGAGGLSSQPTRTLTGSPGWRLGAALAVLDWDGDGTLDLAVGAPGAGGGSGRVFIHLGPVIGGGGSDAQISVGPGSAALDGGAIGSSLAAADFDGDGTDDLVIGAPGARGGDGAAVILFGGGSGAIALDENDPSGPAGYLVGEQAGVPRGRFGEHVFGLGPTESPVDGDDDVGVAYRDQDVAFVLRGRQRPAAGLAPLTFDAGEDLRLENPSADATTGFGAQMASLGDQDGDGTRELAIAAWLEARGRVYLVRGGLAGVRQTDGPAVLTTILGRSDVTRIGAAIAAGRGDLDMDGREDLVLAGDAGRLRLYAFFGGSIPPGRVDVAFAPYQESGPPGFLGEVPGGALPVTLTWAGDVDDDGLRDLVWADPAATAFQLLWDE